MDAWFQRVIAKGGEQQPGQGTGSAPETPGRRSGSGTASAVGSGGDRASSTLGAQTQHTSRSTSVQSVGSGNVEGPSALEFAATISTVSTEVPTNTKQSDAVGFELEVRLSGEVLGTLKFGLSEDVDVVCKDFVVSHHLRDIFVAPLEAHLELMVYMGKRCDVVDVIDII